MKLFLLLNLLLVLTGCNSELASLSPISKTRIQVTANIAGGVVADKIMLWGKSENGSAFSRIIRQGRTETFIFPNGSYTLYAIAWTGANLSGDVYCSTTPLPFSGPDLPVNLNLTNADCDVTLFRGNVTSVAPLKPLGTVRVAWCESLGKLSASFDECSDNLSSGMRKEARGHALSYRFRMQTFDKKGANYTLKTDSIESGCLNGESTDPLSGLAQDSLNQLPYGDGSTTPFYITVEAFPGSTTCDSSSHGMKTVSLKNGLLSDNSTARYFANGTLKHKLFLRMTGSDICTGTTLQKTFAGGTGSTQSPYLICNAAQFYNMRTSAASSFKLMSDIDLSRYYYGITSLPGIPENLTCLKKGSNFLPLGYDTNCTQTIDTFTTSDFDGGGKTIKNLRIDMPLYDNVGLYTRKHGGEVRRLKLQNVLMKGKLYVGAIAGITETRFRDIVGDGIYIDASNALVGGLAGANLAFSTCEFRNIKLTKLSVTGNASNVGGIIGDTTDCNISNSSASGYIFSHTSNYVGGLAGVLRNGSISESSFEGYVKANGYVGGLVGMLDESNMSDSYAIGGVLGAFTGNGIYAGGLAGYTGGTPSASIYMTNNYFFGQVDHFCTSLSVNCSVSNIVGDPGNFNNTHLDSNIYFSPNSLAGLTISDTGTFRLPEEFFDTATSWSPAFSKLTGDFPRLTHQVNEGTSDLRHPCRSTPFAAETVATQIASGRGKDASPISLCNYYQLKDMQLNSAHAAKSYRILNDIVATEALNPSTLTFTGKLDGEMKGIYRMVLEGNAGEDIAWWKALSYGAVMKNLYIIDARVTDPSTTAASASLLATTNRGTLDTVHTLAVRSTPGTGGTYSAYVNVNYGTIKNSYISGTSTVSDNFANVMHTNHGTFENSWSNTYILCKAGVNCNNIAGIAVKNYGTIRKNEIFAYITDQTLGTIASYFSFGVIRNHGLIEDLHLKDAKIDGKNKAAHAVTVANLPGAVVRRVYNEGRVTIPSYDLPTLNPVTSNEFMNGISSTIGSNDGTVTDLIYKHHATWRYPSQYGLAPGDMLNFGTNECVLTLSGDLTLGPAWEPAMAGPYWARFGLSVGDDGPHMFSQAPNIVIGNDDTIYVYRTRTCDSAFGNPNAVIVPAEPTNAAGKITQAESLTWTPFSSWQGAYDVTTDDSVTHLYEYNRINGVNSTKPVWIFDTTNSLRLYR